MKSGRVLRMLGAVAVLAVAVVLAGCTVGPFSFDLDSFMTPTSVSEAKSARRSERSSSVSSGTTIEDGVLTVGLRVSNSTAPMCYTTSDGEYAGIDVDVAAAIADQLGLDVKYVEVSGISSNLGSTCDIVMDVKSSEDSGCTVVGSYAETASALFHRGTATTLSSSDLSGKSVALQAGSVSERTLANTTLVLTERSCTNLNEAFVSLEAGSVDFALCDAYAGAYLASAYKDIALAGTLDTPTPAGIAVATDDTTLQTSIQTALKSIQGNGVMGIIRSRWIGGMADLTSADQIQGITSSSQVLDTVSSNGASTTGSSSSKTSTSDTTTGTTSSTTN